jgi:hypothetical protein
MMMDDDVLQMDDGQMDDGHLDKDNHDGQIMNDDGQGMQTYFI